MPPRPRTPDERRAADQAVARLVAARTDRAAAIARDHDALRAAVASPATWAEIADALNMSVRGVRKQYDQAGGGSGVTP